jgi:hypothetical protein
MAAKKGSRKETAPMTRLCFQWRRSETGSISAPARNVSVTEPIPARNTVYSVC